MARITLPWSFDFCHICDFLLDISVLTLKYDIRRLSLPQFVEKTFVKLGAGSNWKLSVLKKITQDYSFLDLSIFLFLKRWGLLELCF